MELPNKFNAFVATGKVLDYLLSETHAVGKSKARFFARLALTRQTRNVSSKDLSKLLKPSQ
jgi:hypothetical protein